MYIAPGKEGLRMDGFNQFYNSNTDSPLGFLPLLQPFDLDADKQAYFLSLPENEQLEILRESRGSEKAMQQCIKDRRMCD